MTYKQGLEIGSALMNMGFQYKGIVDDEEKKKREEQEWQWKNDDKDRMNKTYEFANKLKVDPEFKLPEGADINQQRAYFDAKVLFTEQQINEMRNTKEGIDLERSKDAKLHADGIKAANAIDAIQDPEKKRQALIKWFNKYPITGNSIINSDGDKAELEDWNGNKSFQDLPLEQMEKFVGDYYKDNEAALKRGLYGGRRINQHNTEMFLNRTAYKNKKTGEIIYEYSNFVDPIEGKMAPFLSTMNDPNTPPDQWNPIPRDKINLNEYDKLEAEPWKRTAAEKKKEEQGLKKGELENKKLAAETEYIKGGKSDTASNKINQLKLSAYAAFLDGKATDAQKAIIDQDKDPYISEAVRLLKDDWDSMDMTPEEKIAKIKSYADDLRLGNQKSSTGGATAPGTRKPLDAFRR